MRKAVSIDAVAIMGKAIQVEISGTEAEGVRVGERVSVGVDVGVGGRVGVSMGVGDKLGVNVSVGNVGDGLGVCEGGYSNVFSAKT